MANYCISHATIVTMNTSREILEDGYIYMENHTIVSIGTGTPPMADKKGVISIDAQGKIIFPGLINTHNHLFQTLLKGLGDDRVLSKWLTSMTFPAVKNLQYEDVEAAALHGCIENLRCGATTVVDYMYAHPQPHLSDAVIAGFQKTGIRGILARGMLDSGEAVGTLPEMRQSVETVQEDCIRLFDQYHRTADDRIRIWVAPAALWSNTPAMLEMTWDVVQSHPKSGFTAHVSETPFDREACIGLHGCTDVEIFERLGIVGPQVLMVHGVYLSDRDMRMMKHYDIRLSHNTISNMYLSSGVARVPEMIERDITVSLGTDGPASNNSQDMIELLKFTALLHKVHRTDPTIITAEKVLEMATIDGAKSLGWDDQIGSLEVGKRADLFIYNPYASPKSIPSHNPVSTLVYSGSSSCVETVFVQGEMVVDKGKTLYIDHEAVGQACQATARAFAKRAGIEVARPWRSIAF